MAVNVYVSLSVHVKSADGGISQGKLSLGRLRQTAGGVGTKMLAPQQRHSSNEDCLCVRTGGIINVQTDSAALTLGTKTVSDTLHSYFSFLHLLLLLMFKQTALKDFTVRPFLRRQA